MLIDHVTTHIRPDCDQLLAGWNQTQFHIFILVVQGGFCYRVGDESIEVLEGNGLFIRKGSMRSARSRNAKGPHQLYATYFRDLPDEDMGELLDKPYQHFRFSRQYHYLRQRFLVLHEYWLVKLPGWDQTIKGTIMEIIGLLRGELASQELSPSQRNLVQHVREYIVQHYRESIRLQHIADEILRSPAYVSSVFKQATGKSVMDYMHEVRIYAARDMILNTDMSMEEVAEYLGYCNQTYFAQRYKRLMGYPPTHTLRLQQR